MDLSAPAGSLPLLLPLVFLVLAGVAVWWTPEQARKRREAFAAYAASRGWTYVREDPALAHRFAGAPFGRGFGHRAQNVLLGQHDGRSTVAFEYQYSQRTGSGKNRRTSTHHFSVVATHLGVGVLELSVTPENVVTRFSRRGPAVLQRQRGRAEHPGPHRAVQPRGGGLRVRERDFFELADAAHRVTPSTGLG